jgi:hypothetical protein
VKAQGRKVQASHIVRTMINVLLLLSVSLSLSLILRYELRLTLARQVLYHFSHILFSHFLRQGLGLFSQGWSWTSILLSTPPECWNSRHVPSCPVSFFFKPCIPEEDDIFMSQMVANIKL